jgi:hypothetical protein
VARAYGAVGAGKVTGVILGLVPWICRGRRPEDEAASEQAHETCPPLSRPERIASRRRSVFVAFIVFWIENGG